MAVLFLWPSANDERVDISVPETSVEDQLEKTSLQDVGETVMKSPRFVGEDSKNRRWEVKAKEAKQSGVLNPDYVWLDEIEAKAEDGHGTEVTFQAGEGAYVKKDSVLELKGGVKVQGYGFTLETEELKGDLKTRHIQGESTVTIVNEGGILKAGEFELQENGEVIRLREGVHGRFYPKSFTAEQE